MGYVFEGEEPEASAVWGELSGLVDDVLAARAAVAEAQARETELLARAVGLVEQRTAERRARGLSVGNDLPLREIAAELGCAMRVSDRTVQRRISDAYTLVEHYPAVFAAWQAGRIDRAHAQVIADQGAIIGDETVRAEYETLALAVAKVESAGRLRELAAAIAAGLDPAGAAAHRAAATRTRGVQLRDLSDGITRFCADMQTPIAHAIFDRLTEQARLIQDIERQDAADAAAAAAAADDDSTRVDAEANPTADTDGADGAGGPDGPDGTDADAAVDAVPPVEPRTLDQIRADIAADMLLTAAPTAHTDDERLTGLGSIRGTVRVTIPLATLAGVSDQPALLDGVGPVDPDLIRTIAAAAPGWDRVYTNPCTGLPVAVDRYRPTAELKRYLRARDEHCRFPGCRQPAQRCDLDHTIDAAHGGPTSTCNLGDFCRRHHTLKHATPWTVQQLPGGRFRWTSPTGRVYDDHAPATLRRTRYQIATAVSFDGPAPPF